MTHDIHDVDHCAYHLCSPIVEIRTDNKSLHNACYTFTWSRILSFNVSGLSFINLFINLTLLYTKNVIETDSNTVSVLLYMYTCYTECIKKLNHVVSSLTFKLIQSQLSLDQLCVVPVHSVCLWFKYTLFCNLNEWGQEDCPHNVFYKVITWL